MRIAVTTPTGNVGRHVVAMLVRAGMRPLVLARDPDRLDPDLRREIDAVAVDQQHVDAVVAATAGVDALFWVDPTTGEDDPLADYARATASVSRAVRENGIARTVFQSSVGAEKRHGAGEIDGLAATEIALDDAVAATAAAVIHLRCGYFFTNLLSELDAIRAGVLPVLLPTDQPFPWVAPRDIAEVAVTHLLADHGPGRRVQAVHGPEDLSWERVAEIITAATGYGVRAERVSDDRMRELLAGAGMAPAAIESILGMSTGLRDDFVPEQPRDVRTTTPTALAGWAYEVLRPALTRCD